MACKLNPYISFRTEARQALEFYRDVFGGTLSIQTFGDVGDAAGDLGSLVMHGQLETADGFTLMAADTPPDMQYQEGSSISISLSGEDADRLRRWWERLGDGGVVTVPLEKQIWGDEFGMCVDRFGIAWMVNIAGEGR
ncbi:VOC family protein [Nocardia higoensis]|uniref:VOC family protein n=1 Tax=Nocardia higoensis TaxID=228599 RepID=A0ABS0D793_9NOCA|nr:VOC family protein [Nocardia higoensis]MBF6353960.1 VOC family protein [Nocardia higoensis]